MPRKHGWLSSSLCLTTVSPAARWPCHGILRYTLATSRIPLIPRGIRPSGAALPVSVRDEKQGPPGRDTASSSGDKSHVAKSAARALAILGAVEQSSQGKGLAELSTEFGLSKATVLRILRTLVAERVLQRDPVTGLYAPDASSWLCLAPLLHPALSFLSAVQSRLDELAETTHATVVLVLPCAERRYAVGWMHSEPRVPLYFDFGAGELIGVHQIPLHAAAAGKCYLASLGPAALQGYIEEGLSPVTAHTVTSSALLGEELRRVHKQGYAIAEHEAVDGLLTVAVPIGEPGGEVAGAVSVLLVEPKVRRRRALDVLPALRSAADRISSMLRCNWWLENVMSSPTAAHSLALPWDTGDPGFGDGPTPHVRTVARMIRLMASLFANPQGMSLSEVSQARGLSTATAWRLLNTLKVHDVVWRSVPDKRYHIAPPFWIRRCGLMHSVASLSNAAKVILQLLANATGETVSLEFPDREERNAVVYQSAVPAKSIHCHPEHRPPLSLHTTAAGKCYLAALPKRALEDYLRRVRHSVSDISGVPREQLLSELAEVRGRGYALNRDMIGLGVHGLAVPLTDAGGTAAGAITVFSATTKLTAARVRQWLPLLRSGADRLSQLLVADWSM